MRHHNFFALSSLLYAACHTTITPTVFMHNQGMPYFTRQLVKAKVHLSSVEYKQASDAVQQLAQHYAGHEAKDLIPCILSYVCYSPKQVTPWAQHYLKATAGHVQYYDIEWKDRKCCNIFLRSLTFKGGRLERITFQNCCIGTLFLTHHFTKKSTQCLSVSFINCFIGNLYLGTGSTLITPYFDAHTQIKTVQVEHDTAEDPFYTLPKVIPRAMKDLPIALQPSGVKSSLDIWKKWPSSCFNVALHCFDGTQDFATCYCCLLCMPFVCITHPIAYACCNAPYTFRESCCWWPCCQKTQLTPPPTTQGSAVFLPTDLYHDQVLISIQKTPIIYAVKTLKSTNNSLRHTSHQLRKIQ